jgi:predicted amidohydrolase
LLSGALKVEHRLSSCQVFNTGYEYSDQNYLQAESLVVTATWMKQISARYHVHLAGSFLHRANASFNTMLLVAPNSQQWHYDKFIMALERAYFQKGTNITIAKTEFRKIRFLICWDVAHLNLWTILRQD